MLTIAEYPTERKFKSNTGMNSETTSAAPKTHVFFRRRKMSAMSRTSFEGFVGAQSDASHLISN